MTFVLVNGGEYLNEPMNQSLAYNQIKNYEDISKKRFSNIDKTVYASGYRSFFDITPDLRFILGKDSKINNLFHNLGSGQAMKYSPVLGESVAEEIIGEKRISKMFDYSKFNIDRFGEDYMQKFWNLVNGEENTLHRQGKTRFNFRHLLLMKSLRLRFLQKSSLFTFMSFSLMSKLLRIALRTGSAVLIFSFNVFSLIGYKTQLVAASAVIDLDSSSEGPLSPKISPSPI